MAKCFDGYAWPHQSRDKRLPREIFLRIIEEADYQKSVPNLYGKMRTVV